MEQFLGMLILPSLVYLYLSNTTNYFTGNISSISSYSLEMLYLSRNKLQRNIPKSIINLRNLTVLYLSSNNLNGVFNFQHFFELQNLESLYFSHNIQLFLNFESNVNYNFSGSRKLPNLKYLGLSKNKIDERVPNCLLEIVDSLAYLNLSKNLFTSIDKFSGIIDTTYPILILVLTYMLVT
jgi:Leucine-rich repeat (LRR) protein